MTSVHGAEKLGPGQIRAFLEASDSLRFVGEDRKRICGWMEMVLRQQEYHRQGRVVRGLLRH